MWLGFEHVSNIRALISCVGDSMILDIPMSEYGTIDVKILKEVALHRNNCCLPRYEISVKFS